MKIRRITVWAFDDLWEEGYHFDEMVSFRICVVPREKASNKEEAASYLIDNYESIPKQGSESLKMRKGGDCIYGGPIVFIPEKVGLFSWIAQGLKRIFK